MIEYLILDYNRPTEARALLESIKKYSRFNYSVTYLANGGEQDYAKQLREEGLIDNLILNSRNTGCGAGTIQLFAQCVTEFAFYIQVDHVLNYPIESSNIDEFRRLLDTPDVRCIDLAGNQGNPRGCYSERAQFINTAFYNSIPKSIGGPGPWKDMEWTEKSVQDFFKQNNFKILSIYTDQKLPLFLDCGKYSIRSNPDGSEWKQQSDTKQIWMLKPPTQQFTWPHFSQAEWDKVLNTKSWPDGKIPEEMLQHSFELPASYWPVNNL